MKHIAVISLVVALMSALITLATVPPTTLATNLSLYGATVAPVVIWVVYAVCAVAVFYITRYLLEKAKQWLRDYVEMIADGVALSQRRNVFNIDPTTLVESLVRDPQQLESLGIHLGIGKPSTASDSVSVRLEQLEIAIARLAEVAQTFPRMQATFEAEAEHRRQVSYDILRKVALYQRYMRLKYEIDDLYVQIPNVPVTKNWTEGAWVFWEKDCSVWKAQFLRWVSIFPNDPEFDMVRSVLDVTIDQMRLAASQLEIIPDGTSEREDAFKVFAAVIDNFKRRSGHAVRALGKMSAVTLDQDQAIGRS